MDLEWISDAIDALEGAGIAARRGYLVGKIPHLTAPMATVSIESFQGYEMTLTVRIYTPLSMGGDACEDWALTAVNALKTRSSGCKVGACSYQRETGLFCVPITVTFSRLLKLMASQSVVIPAVEADGQVIPYVLAVTTAYTNSPAKLKEETTGALYMAAAEQRWRVTVEDVMDSHYSPRDTLTDGFTLTIYRVEQKEVYSGCCWESIKTSVEDDGIHRTRVAVTCVAPEIQTIP